MDNKYQSISINPAGKLSKYLLISSIILLVFFSLARSSQAATYYVDQNHPQASDSNPGTEDLPWKTIQKAANTLIAGDTVLVKSGTYNVGTSGQWYLPALNPANSGTPGNPITFKAYPGHNVIIQTSSGPAIGSRTREYIVWDGFTVNDATSHSSTTMGPVYFGGEESSYIKGCVIQNCTIVGRYVPTTDNHDGIFAGYTDGLIIRNNTIKGFTGDGFNSGGIKFYANRNAIIENNTIYDNIVGAHSKYGGNHNFIYRKNLFYNNSGINLLLQEAIPEGSNGHKIYQNIFIGNGIQFWVSTSFTNIEIYNNIFYGGKNGDFPGEILTPAKTPNFQLWNNIFYTSGYAIVASEGGTPTYSNYNDFYSSARFVTGLYTPTYRTYETLSDWRSATGFDLNSINQDPLFVNPTNRDFYLQSNSPCLNAGIDRQDYDGDGNTTERINMGAYITGNECIGLLDNCQQQIDTTPPAPPTGVTIS